MKAGNNTGSLFATALFTLTAGLLLSWGVQQAAKPQPSANPFWQVLDWAFPWVWGLMYAFMGWGLGLICLQPPSRLRLRALLVFLGQFLLHLLWIYLFTVRHNTDWSLVLMIVLWVTVLYTVLLFGKLAPRAAWCLLPYLGWLSILAIQNAILLRMAQGF